MAIIYCLARQGSQGYATPAKGLEDNLTALENIKDAERKQAKGALSKSLYR